MGRIWTKPALWAAVFLMGGCDSVEVGEDIETGAYHSKALGIRFHKNDSHVIREKTESDLSSLTITPIEALTPWAMGGIAMPSSATETTDVEDIETLMEASALRFRKGPERGQRNVPSVGTYAKLSGIVMVSISNEKDSMAMDQEQYYMAANGRVYTFLFTAPSDGSSEGRDAFETFFTSIRFE